MIILSIIKIRVITLPVHRQGIDNILASRETGRKLQPVLIDCRSYRSGLIIIVSTIVTSPIIIRGFIIPGASAGWESISISYLNC